ncbi:Rne/Rng family ribonuclease [Actinocorallia sp. API 0066]|nr:Rne/Rng family ribonuclease [Actinocorallia sp. API 0066]MCD0452871.1 Rne/Rng family ribonuclease [Actinocorallia sp. API 0066]
MSTARGTRRAARPAGPPPEPADIDAEEAAEIGPDTELAEPTEDLPEVSGEAAAVLESAVTTPEPKTPAKRTRTRRRTAEPAASAEPEEAEAGAPAETLAAGAPAEPGRAGVPAGTRAAGEAGAPAESGRTGAPTGAAAERGKAGAPAGAAAESGEAGASAGAGAADGAAGIDETGASTGARGVGVSTAAGVAGGAGDEGEEPRKRTRRRQRGAEEPAVPLVADPFSVTRPFATPFTPPVRPAEPEAATPPDVVFQPPMVVFQPPSVVERRAEAQGAPEPEPEAELELEQEEEHAEEEAVEAEHEAEESEDTERPTRRRRRRGGRGRGRARDESAEDEGAEGDEADHAPEEARAEAEEQDHEDEDDGEHADGDEEQTVSSSRRRRRRRRRSGGDEDEPQPDDPPNTVVRVRAPRVAKIEDEVQAVRGSTRLEAKKQRRREGREHGRRRPPIITESEFLARRESVERVMVVRQQGERTQIGVLEDGVLVEHYVDRASHQSYVGNVYLGKVQNVLPSMEAAFVDIGKGRNAVLYAGEVNWDVAGLVGQPRRIESALKSGQAVLVQVTKDPLGHKGARLTSQISLPGRYLVYVPDGSMTGISRKLPDKERTRLKSILRKIMPENAGVIVRTAAEGASEEELTNDITRLSQQWERIQKQVKTASAPSLLHGEPDLTIRVIRDIFNEDFVKLVVAGDGVWDQVQDYVDGVAPHLADRTERWEGSGDAFAHYRIDEQLAKALERKVWLPSGGSLVIDRTEAMTVVDVNTGKFTGQGGNLEETVTRNNLEAAEEIVRQLRLRDLGGIIVIDFIDMVLESNRDLVLRRLLECLARDRTKHQVAEVTSLGLVQMTRKRVGSGLLEAFSEVCECCNGRGIHVQLTPVDDSRGGGENGGGRKRKRKGEIERVVEAKIARQDTDSGRQAEPEPAPEPPAAEPEPKAKARTRTRKTRPAGPPPEDDDIGTVAVTLDSGETVKVEAVVRGADPDAEQDGTGEESAPKRRRTRRPTRAEKIEAAKTSDTE